MTDNVIRFLVGEWYNLIQRGRLGRNAAKSVSYFSQDLIMSQWENLFNCHDEQIYIVMKIFYVYTALTTIGGVDRVITEKANWLSEHGYEVAIVTDTQMGRPPEFPLAPRVCLINLAIYFSKEYGQNFLLRTIIHFKLMCIYRRKMTNMLMKERPDIAFITKIKDGSKKLSEAHTTKHFIRNFHLLESQNLFYRYLTKFFRWHMDKQVGKLDPLVVLTQQHADDWKGLAPVCMIPNALLFYPKQISSCENKQAIAVGRYTYQKGFDLLLQAWRIVFEKHPYWRFDIYGSGERDEYKCLGKELGVSEVVTCHPAVSDVYEKYGKSSIFVLSSRYEVIGLVLAETKSTGVPVVSFACPCGPLDIITNGTDGILIEKDDVYQLAKVIFFYRT